MTLWQRSLEQASLPYQSGLYLVGRKSLEEAPIPTRYEILRALYQQNGLYASVGKALYDEGLWLPSLKPLGNPTSQVVEFYAATLLTGDLQPVTENERILKPLQRVWAWSNFEAQRLVLSRENAMLGDSFVKVVSSRERQRVYFELLDPSTVIDFDVDERGFVVWIRIEVPQTRRLPNGTLEAFTHVEVWSKAEQSYRRWEYRETTSLRALDDDLARLGPPQEERSLAEFGYDYVPVVHIPFRRVPGELRGQAAVWPSIDKIVNYDLILTALHSNYFAYDRPTMVLQSPGRDASNRPIPPPQIQGATSDGERDTVTLGRERIYRLPGGWELNFTVPPIQFDAGLAIVQDYQQQLERERPELVYSRIAELGGNLSGRAIRFMLTKALKSAEEARANLEQGLARADMMALTQGEAIGLWRGIGTFDAAQPRENFAHTFSERPILPEDEQEDAQAELTRAQAFTAWRQAGLPAVEALRRLGYPDEQAAELVEAMAGELEADDEVEQ